MSGAHIHLLLNHIPVLGVVFGLLIFLVAIVRQNPETVRIALGLFVLAGLASIMVFLTGEPAEELVEDLPDVMHAIVETHEEAGLIALIFAVTLGVVSLIEMFVFRQGLPKWAVRGTLVLALVVGGVLAWTANLGGQISHPEIRNEAAITYGVDAASGHAGAVDAND